jgi:Na+-translocating ferredoxin:NAD+ oxidoreductase RnfC subunit
MTAEMLEPDCVRVPLRQHIGAVARPTVEVGADVSEGALIGDIPEGELGATVHASISGRVTEIANGFIKIER